MDKILLLLVILILHLPFQGSNAPQLPKNIEKTVRRLTSVEFDGRAFRSEGGRKAAEYLAGLMKEAGLEAPGRGYLQPIDGGGQNVIGLVRASGPRAKDEYIIVAAHYDSFGGELVGAADNAAGVAVMIELARLATKETLPRHLLFIAFDGGEQGGAGARYYLDHPVIPIAKTVATVSLRNFGRGMSGYLPETLYLFGAESSAQFRDAIARHRKGASHLAVLGVDALHPLEREHFDLSAAKIPFLLITNGYQYTAHSRQDTADRLDFAALGKHVETLSGLLFEIARTGGRIESGAEPVYDGSEAADFDRLLTALREAVIKSPGNEAGLAGMDDIAFGLRRFRDRPVQEAKARGAVILPAARLCWMLACPSAVEYSDLLARARVQESRGEREKAAATLERLLKLIEDEYRRGDREVQALRDRLRALRN